MNAGVTDRQQLLLIGLSIIVAGLAVAPPNFQQLVINSLVEDDSAGPSSSAVLQICARREKSRDVDLVNTEKAVEQPRGSGYEEVGSRN